MKHSGDHIATIRKSLRAQAAILGIGPKQHDVYLATLAKQGADAALVAATKGLDLTSTQLEDARKIFTGIAFKEASHAVTKKKK